MAEDKPQPGLPPGMEGMPAPFANLLNDPAIFELAQDLQRDPAFQQMQDALAKNFGPPEAFANGVGEGASKEGGEGGEEGSAGEGESAAAGAGAAASAAEGGAAPQMPTDPAAAFEAMQTLYQNPHFLQMAQKIGESLLQQNPIMRAMMDPSKREAMQGKFDKLKEDPELAHVMAELEGGDPQVMMKYWSKPEVFQKFSEVLQDVLGDEEGAPAPGEEAEEDVPPSMQLYAGEGNVEALKKLFEEGIDIDNVDEEGRTGLHFACGYGEMECVEFFLGKGAKMDLCDANKNTALHYAAGYGQVDVVKKLVEKGANMKCQNEDGNTPKEVAELNEKSDIVSMLEKAMTGLSLS